MWAYSNQRGHLAFMHSHIVPSGSHVFLRTMTSRMAWMIAEVAAARGYVNFSKFDEMTHMMNLAVLHKERRKSDGCANLRSETRVNDSWYTYHPISAQITASLFDILDIGNTNWMEDERNVERVHRIRHQIIAAFDRVRANLEEAKTRSKDKELKLERVIQHLNVLRPLEGNGLRSNTSDIMRAAADSIVADITSHSRRELWHEVHQSLYLLRAYDETYAQLDSGEELYEPVLDTAITAIFVSLVSDRLMRLALSKRKDDAIAAEFIRSANNTAYSLNRLLTWNEADSDVAECRTYYMIMKYCKKNYPSVKQGIDALVARLLSSDIPQSCADELSLVQLAAKHTIEYKQYLTDVVRILIRINSEREAETLRPLLNSAVFMRAITISSNNAGSTEALTYILTDAAKAANADVDSIMRVWKSHLATCTEGQPYGNYMWTAPEWLLIADKFDFSLLIV